MAVFSDQPELSMGMFAGVSDPYGLLTSFTQHAPLLLQRSTIVAHFETRGHCELIIMRCAGREQFPAASPTGIVPSGHSWSRPGVRKGHA